MEHNRPNRPNYVYGQNHSSRFFRSPSKPSSTLAHQSQASRQLRNTAGPESTSMFRVNYRRPADLNPFRLNISRQSNSAIRQGLDDETGREIARAANHPCLSLTSSSADEEMEIEYSPFDESTEKRDQVMEKPEAGTAASSLSGFRQDLSENQTPFALSPNLRSSHTISPRRQTSLQESTSDVNIHLDENTEDGQLTAEGLLKYAQDIQSKNAIVQRQRQEIAVLHQEKNVKAEEVARLENRLEEMKKTAKRISELCIGRMTEYEVLITTLRHQSKDGEKLFAETKASLLESQRLRETLTTVIDASQTFLEGGAQHALTSEARTLVGELKLECANSERVIQLLRDQMQNVGAELAEAKLRITELETIHDKDRDAFIALSEKMSAAVHESAEMAKVLSDCKAELKDALGDSARAEAANNSAKKKISELEAAISGKEHELNMSRMATEELSHLRVLLEERSRQLCDMEALKIQLGEALIKASERDASIRAMEKAAQDSCSRMLRSEELANEQRVEIDRLNEALHVADTKNRRVVEELTICNKEFEMRNEELTLRLEQKEKAHTAALLTMDKLQFNIREAENREMQAATHQAELIAQKDASDNLAEHYSKEVSAKEHIIAEYVKQQDGWIEKARLAESRAEILQNKYDDQSLALRIAKDEQIDLQERLTSFQNDHRASEERLVLDARIFGQQIAHLEHRLKESDVVRSNLQDQLADLQRNLSTTTQQLASRDAKIMEQAIHSATHESELTRLHHDFDINIRLLEQERSNNLAIQNKLIPGLDAIHRRMDEQQQQNESMAPPPCDHEAAIATYKARITDLESFVSALELRSRTLSVRFETGDLNAEEKTFLGNLMQTSKNLKEREIIDKNNELKIREFKITQLENQVAMLQSAYERALNEYGTMSQWGTPSSPARPADDGDPPSTNNDTHDSQPAVYSIPPAPAENHRVTIPLKTLTTQVPAAASAVPPLGTNQRLPASNFTELAAESSDTIEANSRIFGVDAEINPRKRRQPTGKYEDTTEASHATRRRAVRARAEQPADAASSKSGSISKTVKSKGKAKKQQ